MILAAIFASYKKSGPRNVYWLQKKWRDGECGLIWVDFNRLHPFNQQWLVYSFLELFKLEFTSY